MELKPKEAMNRFHYSANKLRPLGTKKVYKK